MKSDINNRCQLDATVFDWHVLSIGDVVMWAVVLQIDATKTLHRKFNVIYRIHCGNKCVCEHYAFKLCVWKWALYAGASLSLTYATSDVCTCWRNLNPGLLDINPLFFCNCIGENFCPTLWNLFVISFLVSCGRLRNIYFFVCYSVSML